MITARSVLARLLAQDRLNFALTNRVPRRMLTLLMARFSRIEQPLIRDLSLGLWRALSDLDLSDARERQFRSLHDCFTRELSAAARPLDPDLSVLISPCDAVVGATGTVSQGLALQAKDSRYSVEEFLGDQKLAEYFEGGIFLTLRLTASMYHRFHAPQDLTILRVCYFPGDVWNVNPPALRRVASLFCRNERASLECRLAGSDDSIMLVPVAAILVASIRLHCLPERFHLRYRGPAVFHPAAKVRRGDELGWFEHGSTIIVLAPPGFRPCPGLAQGARIRMGQALLRRS